MLYGMIFIGSLLYFLGKDCGFGEIILRGGGAGLVLSAFLAGLSG